MHRSILYGLAAALAFAYPLLADDARDSADLAVRVRSLVRKLDSDSRRERAAAAAEMLKLGPSILPHLPPPDLVKSASVRESLTRIRVALERRQAAQSVQPARVTFSGRMSVDAVCRELTQQTGNRIAVDAALAKRSIDVDWKQTPFWRTIDEIASTIDADVNFSSTGLRLAASSGGRRELVADGMRAFRVSIVSAKVAPLFGDSMHSLLRVQLRVAAEPRLRPLFLKYRGKDLVCSTDDGKSLAPFNARASYELPLGEGREVRLQADFKVPTRAIPRAVKLTGRLTMTTAAGSEEIEFTELTKATGVARRRGGVTVQLSAARFSTGKSGKHAARVLVSVAWDAGGPAFESHRTWVFHNRVFLQTAAGKRITPTGPLRTELQRSGAVAVQYQFTGLDVDPRTCRFVYAAPTLIVDAPIEFRFEKVAVSP